MIWIHRLAFLMAFCGPFFFGFHTAQCGAFAALGMVAAKLTAFPLRMVSVPGQDLPQTAPWAADPVLILWTTALSGGFLVLMRLTRSQTSVFRSFGFPWGLGEAWDARFTRRATRFEASMKPGLAASAIGQGASMPIVRPFCLSRKHAQGAPPAEQIVANLDPGPAAIRTAHMLAHHAKGDPQAAKVLQVLLASAHGPAIVSHPTWPRSGTP